MPPEVKPATPAAAPVAPAAAPNDGTKVIATPSYSKRIARDLAKVEADRKAIEEKKRAVDAFSPKVQAYQDALALVKAGKFKEFLEKTGLTREQIAQAYGFSTVAEAKAAGVPMDDKSKPPETAKDDPVEDLRKQLAEMKSEREAEKKAAESARFEAAKKSYLDTISEAVTKDPDGYAYTSQALALDAEDTRALMYEVADEWAKAHPDEKNLPTAKQIADGVEAYYEEEAARYSKVQKKPKAAPEEKPADPAAPDKTPLEKKLEGEKKPDGQAWKRPDPQQVIRELREAAGGKK